MRSSGTCPVVSASMPGMPICLVGEGLRTPVLTVAQLRRRFRNVIAFMLETRRVVLCRGRSHAVFAVDGTLYTENRSVGMHALVLLFTCTSFCGLRFGGTLRCPEADGNHFVEFCPRPRLFSCLWNGRCGTGLCRLQGVVGQQGWRVACSNSFGRTESSQSLAAPARAGLRRPGIHRWSRRC